MSNEDIDPKTHSLARLAASLLPPGSPASYNSQAVSEAVELASSILKRASTNSQDIAYRLFPREAELGMRDIANIFRDHGWGNLTSHNAIIKLVRRLLDALHRDIQARRLLVAAAFRNNSLRVDPEEAEHEAGTTIINLLRKLGMDIMLTGKMEDVVDRLWHDLLEECLHSQRKLKEELSKTTGISAALFSAICVDSSYEEFAARLRPPAALHSADGLLDLILWMNTGLQRELGVADHHDKVSEQLFKLNFWAESLSQNSSQLSKPFTECIASLMVEDKGEMEQEALEALKVKFDLGIQRFSRIWGHSMLAEFSMNFGSESLWQHLGDITDAWDTLDPKEKARIGDGVLSDPPRVIGCVSSFLRHELPFFPVRLPFHGNGVASQIVRPYHEDLDRLLHSIRQLRELGRRLFVTESRNPSRSETGDELVAGSENKPESELQKLEDAIRSEKTRIIELSEKLADLDDAETQRRVKRVGTLMASLAKEFSPGRINPHLLFRYAAQRGLMEDLLVRR